MKKFPLVTVVILNYNGMKYLHGCLDSVIKSNYPNLEVVLVDNGSTDCSIEYVSKRYPHLGIIRLERNFGAAAGFNTGMKASKGRYVVTLANDVEVDPDLLRSLVYIMEAHPSVAACDPKFLDLRHKEFFDSTAGGGRYIDMFGNVMARGKGERDIGQYDRLTEVFVAATMYRRKAIEEVGYLDETFFYGYEDVDLSWRLRLKGYHVLYVPSGKIFHGVSKSVIIKDIVGSKLRPAIYFHIKKNRLQMLLKNCSFLRLVAVIPIVLLEYSGYSLFWVMKQKLSNFREIVLAFFYILKNMPDIWRKRIGVQRCRTISDSFIQKYMVGYCGDLRGNWLHLLRHLSD